MDLEVISVITLKRAITYEILIEKATFLTTKRFRPGFDKMTAEAALLWIQLNGNRLIRDIQAGRYSPMPALTFTSAKKNGSYRRLALCTAIDTIIQYCLLDALNGACEELFHPFSFAYRTGRGVIAALQQYRTYCETYPWAAKLDVIACYDHIDHQVLLKALSENLSVDAGFLSLIEKFIQMPVLVEGLLEQRSEGILQGMPLSPVLCNLYFHQLDMFLEARGIPFIRYADDLVFFGTSADAVRPSFELIKNYETEKMFLQNNPSKSRIGPSLGFTFLGHRFTRDKRGLIVLNANDTAEGSYYTWHDSKLQRNHGITDILSDGILRQKDYSLLFESAEEKYQLPLEAVDLINIYSSVVFDTGFLQKALDHHIYINLFDRHGVLIGRFTPYTTLKAPIVTHKQLELYYHEKTRLYLAKQFVLASLHNTKIVLRYYQKHHPQDIYAITLESLNDLTKRIKTCPDYEKLLLLEANVRKEYYGCFDFIISQESFVFDQRQRRPPGNEVNALMSFGYTVLYNLLAHKINRSPLDIRIGYLHSTNGFRKESLNLDLAEIFKPIIVDRVLFSLLNLRSITAGDFRRENNGGVYLTENGKRKFLTKFYEKLYDTLCIKSRFYSYDMLLDEEVRKLVRYFRNGERYSSYRQVR